VYYNLQDVAKHVRRFPDCGIDPLKFSNIRAFRRRTEELKNEAAGMTSMENLEEVEKTAEPLDLASFQSVCKGAEIEWKYKNGTTNHYVHLMNPQSVAANVPDVAQQVRAILYSFLHFTGLADKDVYCLSSHSLLLLITVDYRDSDDE
jgi:hypothetical protein